MFRDLHRDAKLLMASRGIRSFAFSYVNVVFAIYLDQLGYSTVTIGIIFSVAYLSGAVLTAVWGYLSDRFGRRNILMLLAVLTIISNCIYVFFSGFVFILLAVVIANVGSGGSAGGGQGGGPFNPVEEALLAEKCTPENRNRVFAVNSCVGALMGSFGALASGFPQLLAIVDNFGAGMAGALVSYWFFLRFGVQLKSLGMIFFASYFLAAVSFLSAPLIALRLGVVRTMAFSHGLASIIYLVLPLAPTLAIAASLLMIRSFFAYMDNPLRASFTMAMVNSNERGSAAGVTSLARIIPYGISPTFSTYLMQSVSLTLPLFIGGGLQLINDVAFYLLFRHVRPPEELKDVADNRAQKSLA